MNLVHFISDLREKGSVTVAGRITSFDESDLQQSLTALHLIYEQDTLHMPFRAPGFCAEAALWAAAYLYRAVQVALMRDLDNETVENLLAPYPGKITPEAVYSADLALRHLPALMMLARGLAPGDVLVQRLQQTAREWPFSTAGMDVAGEGETVISVILEHPSLKNAYIDRIIEARDAKRINHPAITEGVREALGQHAGLLWPEKEFTGL